MHSSMGYGVINILNPNRPYETWRNESVMIFRPSRPLTHPLAGQQHLVSRV